MQYLADARILVKSYVGYFMVFMIYQSQFQFFLYMQLVN